MGEGPESRIPRKASSKKTFRSPFRATGRFAMGPEGRDSSRDFLQKNLPVAFQAAGESQSHMVPTIAAHVQRCFGGSVRWVDALRLISGLRLSIDPGLWFLDLRRVVDPRASIDPDFLIQGVVAQSCISV